MTPRTKEQNEDIRLRRLAQIRKAAADVFLDKGPLLEIRDVAAQADSGMVRYITITAIKAICSTICYGTHWTGPGDGWVPSGRHRA